MTFSVVARSADGRSLGVAVASRFLAVGAAVPAVEAAVGALATQAQANLAYRPQGLQLLRGGLSAAAAVAKLTGDDADRAVRQLGVVASTGPGATFTGQGCEHWAGGVAGDGYAIQGNILTGPEVVDAMREAWLGSDPAAPLARRLLDTLAAGDAAGGDSRGRQSAAVLIARPGGGYLGTSDIEVDLRVDDSPAPIARLIDLLDLHALYFTRPDPATLLPLAGDLAAEVSRRLAALGYPARPGEPAALDVALARWAGRENLEERLRAGFIDPEVLRILRDAAR